MRRMRNYCKMDSPQFQVMAVLFWTPRFRIGLIAIYCATNVPKSEFLSKWLKWRLITRKIVNRLKARNATAGEISDARLEDLETLSAAYQPASELAANLIKISTDGELSDTIRAVLLRLAEKQSAIVNSPHNFSGT